MPDEFTASDMSDLFRKKLQELFQEVSIENRPPALRGLVTDFILIVEGMGDDGGQYLGVFPSANSQTWKHLGMLDYAHTIISHIAFDHDHGE